ncbi:MAG TPA: putative PEP-binding protein, partial [Solirubrobacteraceae bacterium]|nr:putative PEP-binding protein [Solirubrobacteraceae bacterium]
LGRAGIMIEVPAAALTAEHILPRVDFVSVGTNDLTQYTYAADRMHGGVAELNDHWQPGVSRLIEMVGRAGAETATPVGVCGEAAADAAFAAVLVGLGVRSLSMAPSMLATVDTALATVSLDECRSMAKTVLAAQSAASAREQARRLAPALHQALLDE